MGMVDDNHIYRLVKNNFFSTDQAKEILRYVDAQSARIAELKAAIKEQGRVGLLVRAELADERFASSELQKTIDKLLAEMKSSDERHATVRGLIERDLADERQRREEAEKERDARRDLQVALESQLLSRYVELFPNYAWADAGTAIDLMAAEITTARSERDAAEAKLAEAQADTRRLDWFSAPHGCEPMEATRYDGARQWRYMGIWYDSLRVAIDAAMNSGKGERP